MKKCTEKYVKLILKQINPISLLAETRLNQLGFTHNINAITFISSRLERIILTKNEDLNDYIEAGVFDGNNATSKLTRQLFIELTGVTLPKSAKATRVKLEKYIKT